MTSSSARVNLAYFCNGTWLRDVPSRECSAETQKEWNTASLRTLQKVQAEMRSLYTNLRTLQET